MCVSVFVPVHVFVSFFCTYICCLWLLFCLHLSCLYFGNVLNPHLNNKPLKLFGDLSKSIPTSSKLVVSTTAAHVKDCKVVLEDISSSCDAVKLKMLNTSQENTHTTSSHLTKEERLLEGLSVKTPIAWGQRNDKHWAQLDDVDRMAGPSANTIYNEAANIFDHSQPPKRNLARPIRRTKLSI